MTDINIIISTLNTNEKQSFINYLETNNKRTDTKNIKLFKILAEGETNSKTICKRLYKTDNKNAYHALRKRLLDSLIDFTANKNLEDENSVDIQIIKYLLASRTFLIQKNFNIAYKLLDKAENIAEEHGLFPILNEIYHTKIQYASEYKKANLDLLISKQKSNQKKHLLEDQLNIIYSKLKVELHAIKREKKVVNFEKLLENTIKDSNIKLDESLSFKSLYQILAIANISAFVNYKYYQIEDFVLKSYNILKSKKETNKQLFYQIHIVYIIANTLFRNKKFNASLDYINEMENLMTLKKGKYNNEFSLKHTLVKALNLNFNGDYKNAIGLVEKITLKKHRDTENFLDLQLCLIMFYFQQSDFRKAKSILSKFYHTDNWYLEKAGIDWVIKKNITELLLYIEIEEHDLFESRLKSFRRLYSKYLKSINQDRILIFLKFAEKHCKNPRQTSSTVFKTEVENAFEWKSTHEEDIFVMSFYAWLKSKLDNVSLYKTTLRLIEK